MASVSNSSPISLMGMGDTKLVQPRMLFNLVCEIHRASPKSGVNSIQKGSKQQHR